MAFFLFSIIPSMIKLLAKHRVLIVLVFALLALLAACGQAPATPEATEESSSEPTATQITSDEEAPATEESYPGPEAGEEEAYPAPGQAEATPTVDGPYPPPTTVPPTAITSYPEALPENTPENGVVFAFERPINVGDTIIRGVGPAGLEIKIINVTFMGEEIATTTVESDGTFEVEVPALEAGVRIGLTADIEGTDLEERIIPGEGAMGVPQVGYYFDTIVLTGNS